MADLDLVQRFKKIRQELKLTQDELGQELGITGAAISDIERGKSNPSIEIIKNLETKLKINSRWLLTGEGEMFLEPFRLGHTRLGEGYLSGDLRNKVIVADKDKKSEVVYLPVLDTKVSAGYGIENFEVVYTDTFGIERRLIFPYSPERCKILPVRGDSMVPTLYEGDWIIVAEGIIDTNGIYVINRGGLLFVKRIEFKLASNSILIKSDNPNYAPEEISRDKIQEYFVIIGRVILHIHPSR